MEMRFKCIDNFLLYGKKGYDTTIRYEDHPLPIGICSPHDKVFFIDKRGGGLTILDCDGCIIGVDDLHYIYDGGKI